MPDALALQAGAAATLLVAVFAFLKGDEPERIGAGACALALMVKLLVPAFGVGPGVLAVDLALLAVFAALAGKSRRVWTVCACGVQTLAFVLHLLSAVAPRPLAFHAVIGFIPLAVLPCLAVGVILAWRDRRAAGLDT